MRFHEPWWLVLAPLAILLVLLRARPVRQPAALFSSLSTLRELPVTLLLRLRRFLPGLEILGLLLLVGALARPQRPLGSARRITEGVAIQLVVDRSGSMEELDLDEDPWDRRQVRRLDVVKDVLRDFVDPEGDLPGRPDDLLGLVTFAGFVQTPTPLTLDHSALTETLRLVDVPRVDARRDPAAAELVATALGDALMVAVAALEEVPTKSKVVVLLSDGRGNVGLATPESAAELAHRAGIRIHAVGIGQPGPELGDESLKAVAETTGGQFFLARSARDLHRIYAEIDRLERSEVVGHAALRYEELFPWPLAAGLLVLGLHRVLLLTRFRSLP